MTKIGAYKIEKFKPTWGISSSCRSSDLNRAFLATKKVGVTLNVCSGTDNTGNIHVDIDAKMNPDIVADIHNLPFRSRTFDTVICDPPFNYYFRFKWIPKIASLARKRVILSTPQTLISLGKGWNRVVWFIDSARHYMRIW